MRMSPATTVSHGHQIIAVFLGGSLGVALRLVLDEVLPHAPGELPASTLIANLVGSFALGFLVARVWPTAAPWLKSAVGPGLLGGFTTFSAVVVTVVDEFGRGDGMLAAGYLATTILLGLAAAAAGLWLGQRGRPAVEIDVDE